MEVVTKTSAEASRYEVERLEDAEYLEAVDELLELPAFHRFMVRWLIDSGESTGGPVEAGGLALLNFQRGRASKTAEFMESLEVKNPAQFLALTQERLQYVARRNRIESRADDDGFDPDDH